MKIDCLSNHCAMKLVNATHSFINPVVDVLINFKKHHVTVRVISYG